MIDFHNIQDFENRAVTILADNVRDYYLHRADSKTGIDHNVQAFKKWKIRPRLLRNVADVDISTTVLGERVSMPLGVSPTAHQKCAHSEGECANVKATQAANSVFILSSYANSTIQEVAEAAPKAVKWMQLAIYKDRDLVRHIVRRAEDAGFKALVVTIDNPVIPKSNDNKLDNMPEKTRRAIFDDYFMTKDSSLLQGDVRKYILTLFDNTVTWKDVSWLKSITKLPIVLKGVLAPEDALLAVNHGANAILVSNHGGRLYDGVVPTIEALPDIVKAVGDKVEIYLDGGVRQGTDIFRALALGAKMVFIGRPMLWGLACGGEEGARAVLEILRQDLSDVLSLTGCKSIKDVARDMLIHEKNL